MSPVYDINPNHYRGGLKLNIFEYDNSQDFSLALGVAPFFRLSGNEAEMIINNIKKVVCDWRIYYSHQLICQQLIIKEKQYIRANIFECKIK